MWKFTSYCTIMALLIFLRNHTVASSAALHLSPTMQKVALFQFKLSLNISTITQNCYYDSYSNTAGYEIPSYPKTVNWSMSSNYCTWEGVSCEHKTGNVIGLDLSCSRLEGAILPNSTLFQLSHLQFLNLSNNHFYPSKQFPQEFGFFAKGLTHLNLSYTGFSGRVPSGISGLHKLVSLDLSGYSYGALELEDEVFKSLLQNLTQLRVLNLEAVNVSSVLPVNLSTSLRVLNLGYTDLHGVLPQEVFHLPNLEVLYLSDITPRGFLNVTLPKVKWGSSATLQHLRLGLVNINGGIPDSIVFAESLVSLRLSGCNLSGPIPALIGNLSHLTYLGLDRNNLNGPIPTFIGNLDQLSMLDLSYNNINGPIPTFIGNLDQLSMLDLSYNNLNGPIPTFIRNLDQLSILHLSYNNFNGPILTFIEKLDQLFILTLNENNLTGPIPIVLANLTNLIYLDLSSNNFIGQLPSWVPHKSHLQQFICRNNLLSGPIPQSFSQLVNLTYLDLSSNNFSGVLDIDMFSRLEILYHLNLSDNNLSVTSTSMVTLPPRLHTLALSSCNMKEFPHFSRDAELIRYLDLSNNQIEGEIPHWIRLMVWDSFSYLNLSHNRLTGGLEHLPWNRVSYLKLQSNMFNASLPTLICNSTYLEILDLSHNNLSGILPICPPNLTTSLMVFDLHMNNIQGNLPSTLSNFRNLQSINLHGNKLEGRIPSSFAALDQLETLDLGSNQINDTFPQCLEALPNLQVLVLKSNKFHGLVNQGSKMGHPFPSLRIVDLSHNEFSGPLPSIYFRNFKAMMNGEVNKIPLDYMGHSTYYSDSTTLVIKGVDIELVRILTVFTTIDVSRNNFEGEIDESIGYLVSLRYLNFSYNQLTGHIPSSIGKLSMLESLDLSFNRLEGEIPQQLTSINSLARLNLSCNQLTGRIPQGPQFNTFDNDSYVDNLGLCGYPLSKGCERDVEKQKEGEDDDYFFSGFTWNAVVIGYGCGVVPAFIIGYLMLLAGKPKWFVGIIARELGLKIRRMEIKLR